MDKNASYKLKEIQIMFEDGRLPSRTGTGWVSCIIAGVLVDALMFNEPSDYGINDGRISKLSVYKTAMRDRNAPWGPQLDFHYDREEDYCNLTEEELDVVVTALEKLEPVVEVA